MAKIKVIIKRPDEKYGHVTHISPRLENLQKTVEGYIEMVTVIKGVILICNEEGKLRDMPYNFTHRQMFGAIPLQYPIFGTVIACGVDGDEFADIPIDFNEWKSLLCEWGN